MTVPRATSAGGGAARDESAAGPQRDLGVTYAAARAGP